jgi:uncharacterized protein (TIGR00255 family)
MTGFARSEGQAEGCFWSWELKSINAKGLDVRCRVPSGYEKLEKAAREETAKSFKRGNVTVNLTINWQKGDAGFRVNPVVLGDLLAVLPDIRKQLPDAAPPSIDGLLALRGVIEPVEEELTDDAREALESEILESFEAALAALSAMRDEEGARLEEGLDARLDEIAGLSSEAEKLAALQPDAIRERLKTQVQVLMEDIPALSKERLAQEAALLMTKADIREELDRLKAHEQAARDLMGNGGAVGRKLDFLCQEFNREANTLCSKSQDVTLTRIGLDMKSSIEQFREQVQNIE